MKSDRKSRTASRRIYVTGNGSGIRVPMREILLEAPNPPVRLYDTAGPHGDPDCEIDLEKGLPPLREPWIASRGDVEERRRSEADPRATQSRKPEFRRPRRVPHRRSRSA